MTDRSQELYFDSIILDLKANTMKQAFQLISEHVSQMIGTPSKTIFNVLMDHERQEGTSIGNGISMPHMKLARLTKPMTIFVKLSDTINVDTVDNMPIDQVAVVLSPDYEGVKHLQRLSRISRYFKNNNLSNVLRDADDAHEVRHIVKSINDQKMAA